MIYLATPSAGRIRPETAEAAFRDKNSIEHWDIVSSPYVAGNRNALFQNFLKYESTHIVMVDDDVWWGPDVLWLLEKFAGFNPVVFVDMPERQMNTTAYNWTTGYDIVEAPYQVDPFTSDAFGTSMLCMTWQFAKTLPSNPFDHRYRGGYQRREDLSFSMVLEEMGVRPLCIPNQDIIHYCEYGGKRPRRK